MRNARRYQCMSVSMLLLVSIAMKFFTTKQFIDNEDETSRAIRRALQLRSAQPTVEQTMTELTEDDKQKKIAQYLNGEKKRCENETHWSSPVNGRRTQDYCPCISPYLQGRLTLDLSENATWSELYSTVGRMLLAGGEWRPLECTAHTRLAVIIPCRDRDQHLRIMLRHLIPILQRQLTHFRIFVVEQSSPAVFNKAAMMNIGFIEAMKMFPDMNCVMFHDVDHLAEDDRMLMKCGFKPHHYAFALAAWNYRAIYGGLFGGVISMTPDQFRRVNGYPIVYFGWGGEDDDMGRRVRHMFRGIYRPPVEVCRYWTMLHTRDSSNPNNGARVGMLSKQDEAYRNGTFRGMADMDYAVTSIQLKPLFTWIHAALNTTGLPYPTHAVSEYRSVRGVCGDDDANTREVSFITCRYLCDIARQRLCIGFVYFRRKQKHASDVDAVGLTTTTTTQSCVLLVSVCDPVERAYVISGYTYFKLQ